MEQASYERYQHPLADGLLVRVTVDYTFFPEKLIVFLIHIAPPHFLEF
ncbi:hypothetical protein HYR54_14945 [Candidatus Acetothermia bacterium]|nr:hypothetical protein [Candidatus Acetothermia bacterium]